MDNILFEEFKKIELRTGKIKSAVQVTGSEKLLRLIVDIGSEERQIIAGIGKVYSPEELVDKTVIVIINLIPKKLMGEESHGMLLAASSDRGPIFLTTNSEVLPGSIVS